MIGIGLQTNAMNASGSIICEIPESVLITSKLALNSEFGKVAIPLFSIYEGIFST